jgi:hypothetical protein
VGLACRIGCGLKMPINELRKSVEEYAPVLHFHPAEGRFCCFPSDAEQIYEQYHRDWSRFQEMRSPKKIDSNTPCYYEVWSDSEMTQIRYWFWYNYNRFPRAILRKGNHLGDWEHVELRIYDNMQVGRIAVWLLSNHLAARLVSQPRIYTLPNFDTEVSHLQTTHLHVWVALGSHANYPAPDSEPYCHRRIFCDELAPDGEEWYTGNNLIPLEKTNFYSFTGRWGDSKAPRSPTNDYNDRWRNAPHTLPVRTKE